MTNKLKAKKGTSLIVVFIICTVIGILLSTTFFVTSNYGISIVSRKKKLRQSVCPTCIIEETSQSDSGNTEQGENNE